MMCDTCGVAHETPHAGEWVSVQQWFETSTPNPQHKRENNERYFQTLACRLGKLRGNQ